MGQTQGFGCISSENSDRTLQGVITHDGMVYIKFAKIMFSEQLDRKQLDPPTLYLKPAKLRNVYSLNSHVMGFIHIARSPMILLITYYEKI